MNEEKLNMLKSSQALLGLTAKKLAVKQKTASEELAAYRITPETALSQIEFLFKFFDTECFPLSELVADTGKAKSGKTLFLSIVMACALKKNVLGLERIREEPIRVLWYDTEQSAQSTQQILVRRIMPLAEFEGDIDDKFFVFNVRGIGWEKRRELLALAIEEYKPNLVILDGTKDLLTDINDGMQATMVVEDLMGLAQAHNCCIVNVLHQNKSDQDRNMRGWIGTELTNKAFEVWSCSIVPNTDTFKVEHVMSRMKRSEENLYYKLDDNALPCPCEKPDEQPREPNGRFASKRKPVDGTEKQNITAYKVNMAKLNRDYIRQSDDEDAAESTDPEKVPWDLVKLFTDAMEGYSFKNFNQLMATAMSISNIEDKKYYYHLLDEAKQQHIIVQGKDGNNRQCFILNPPEMRQSEPSLPFTESDEPVPY